MKYLIITKECDFVSNSLNAKKHLENSKGNAVMVYDRYGWWIRYAKRINGRIESMKVNDDGIARKWAIDFIKNNKVGTKTKDARREYFQYKITL